MRRAVTAVCFSRAGRALYEPLARRPARLNVSPPGQLTQHCAISAPGNPEAVPMTAASSAAPYRVLPDTVVNEQHYTDESPDHSRDRGPGHCLPRGLGAYEV